MKPTAFFRRARPQSAASFSLFPFLAVLICTMGVLILLLVVISRNIRDQAIAEEVVTPNPILHPEIFGLPETASVQEITEKIKSETETYEWLTQEIRVSKEETLEQLNDARARVGAIEESLKKLIKEVERLHEAMKSFVETNKDPSEDIAQLQKQLTEKLRAKEIAETELKKLREMQEDQKQSYAIVPYRGPNGTFRRPIYIECRADCVVIQPEGIVLQVDDFLTPEYRDNPMEMGVRTVRQYFVETQQLQRDTEPYPLFLVRPTGIYAYEASLRSLGSWKGDFGYELIDEDWKLEFPKPSEELKVRLEQQVQIARTRQAGYIHSEIARGTFKGGTKRQYRASSRGGLEQVGGSYSGGVHPLAGMSQFASSQQQSSEGFSAGSSGLPGASGTQSHDNIQPAQTGRSGQTGQPGQMIPNSQYASQTAGTEGIGMPNEPGETDSGVNNAKNVNQTEKNGTTQGPFGDAKIGMSMSPGAGSTTMTSDSNEQQTGPAVPSLTFEKVTRGPKEGRQKNWALKNVQQSARSVERVVRIKCDTDRFTIIKQPGLYQHKDIMFRNPNADSFVVDNASDRLVQAIWDYMETWDSAGENHFWRPLLKVQVSPGAEAVFEQMKTDLADSGLGIEKN